MVAADLLLSWAVAPNRHRPYFDGKEQAQLARTIGGLSQWNTGVCVKSTECLHLFSYFSCPGDSRWSPHTAVWLHWTVMLSGLDFNVLSLQQWLWVLVPDPRQTTGLPYNSQITDRELLCNGRKRYEADSGSVWWVFFTFWCLNSDVNHHLTVTRFQHQRHISLTLLHTHLDDLPHPAAFPLQPRNLGHLVAFFTYVIHQPAVPNWALFSSTFCHIQAQTADTKEMLENLC